MARTDIAGLLTGVPSGGIDPMAVGGTPAQQRLAFGAQRAQGLQRAARGLMGQSRGTRAEQLQMAMAQLDMSNPDDLRKIAQIQQSTGDLAGAAQTAARIKQIEEQLALRKTRQQQAQEISTQLPEKYSGLAQAVLNQVPGSMEKAIDILGTLEEPPKGDIVNIIGPDRKVVGIATEINGKLFNQQGQPLKLPANYGVSSSIPGLGIRVGEDPLAKVQAKTLETRLADQRKMYDDVVPKQETARQKLATARRLYSSLEKGAPSGTVVEIAAKWAEGVQSIYALTGKEAPQKILEAVNNASALKQIGFEAMQPLIDAQGRGFTDKDREHAKLVLPGLSQSWQYNQMVADLDTLEAYKLQDQLSFANKRKNLTQTTDKTSDTLWNNYLEELPMSKTQKVTEGGLTYDRVIPIKTNEDLSQYWVLESPKGFKVIDGDNVIEFSMQDIRDTAKKYDLSPREFLADLSRQDLLIDGVYE